MGGNQCEAEVPVAIVGGGPVGLVTALLLAHHGVRSLLVERRAGEAGWAGIRLLNARTMEILRQCGAEAAVRSIGLPPHLGRYALRVDTLAGEERERREGTFTAGAQAAFSPVPACVAGWTALKAALRECVAARGATDLRYGAEVTGLAQDAGGVTLTLRDSAGGGEACVRAAYVVAADGARSGARAALGIPRVGRAGIAHSAMIHFRADLRPWLADRQPYLCRVEHPRARGGLFVCDGAERWDFSVAYDPARGERPADFTPGRCAALVRAAAGVPALPVAILGLRHHALSARVAERYGAGRVFLAGDAAHEMPPLGGLGMNTGIQDAHNLAWKLAAVLGGRAAPALLDTYEAERLPIGRAATARALGNVAAVRGLRLGDEAAAAGQAPAGTPPAGRPAHHSEWGLIFGAIYASAAVIPDGTPPPAADPIAEYVPTGCPGARAPHARLRQGTAPRSTLDLFGAGFALLAGPGGRPWCAAGRAVAGARGIPLAAATIGDSGDLADPDHTWPAAYGVGEDGAVLVRPDGHVAWRAPDGAPDPAAVLRQVFAGILGTARERA